MPRLSAENGANMVASKIRKHAYSDFGYKAWDRLDDIRMGTLFDVDGKVINRCRLAIVLELGLFSRTLLENVSLKTNIIRPSICEWFLWADSACKRDCGWLAR
jgi:hypothetical protein